MGSTFFGLNVALTGVVTTNQAVNDNLTIVPFSTVTVGNTQGNNVTVTVTFAAGEGVFDALAAVDPAAALGDLAAQGAHPLAAAGPVAPAGPG